MLDQLTQEQRWGLAYLLQLHNAAIEASNEGIDARNQFKPRSEPLEEPKPLLTLEQFAVAKLCETADMGYQQLIAFKEQEALRLFRSKSPEEQAAIVAKLQIPDVLTE